MNKTEKEIERARVKLLLEQKNLLCETREIEYSDDNVKNYLMKKARMIYIQQELDDLDVELVKLIKK